MLKVLAAKNKFTLSFFWRKLILECFANFFRLKVPFKNQQIYFCKYNMVVMYGLILYRLSVSEVLALGREMRTIFSVLCLCFFFKDTRRIYRVNKKKHSWNYVVNIITTR